MDEPIPDLSADYLAVNLGNWESRVPFHEEGYRLDRYRDDPALLSGVVEFDRPRLGEITGLEAVHLQCHLGTDTLSLARLGARMTGLDFSPSALAVARRLAADCGVEIDYVEADTYSAVEALGGARFDLVYTGIGALCWLPEIGTWAQVVADLLRPGGRLFVREGHPVLWTLAEPRADELVVLEYPYFETAQGSVFEETTSYVGHEGELASPRTVEFNHGLAEIITAVMDAGLRLTAIEEHRSVPWNPLAGEMVELPNGEFELRERPERLPATYTLQAVKT